jgi:hypothetical protein
MNIEDEILAGTINKVLFTTIARQIKLKQSELFWEVSEGQLHMWLRNELNYVTIWIGEDCSLDMTDAGENDLRSTVIEFVDDWNSRVENGSAEEVLFEMLTNQTTSLV